MFNQTNPPDFIRSSAVAIHKSIAFIGSHHEINRNEIKPRREVLSSDVNITESELLRPPAFTWEFSHYKRHSHRVAPIFAYVIAAIFCRLMRNVLLISLFFSEF